MKPRSILAAFFLLLYSQAPAYAVGNSSKSNGYGEVSLELRHTWLNRSESGQPGLLADTVDPSLYQSLRYRLIGPFRASRTVGGVGIPSQPSVFFAGVNNGGVWKTDDYGRTWRPIFDEAPTGSVGDIAVSPSHPDILYVGTGEGLHRPDLARRRRHLQVDRRR